MQYLIWSFETIVFIMAAGYLVGLADHLIEQAIMAVTGGSFGCLFVNYLTFPGVILHELSHALLAVVTGAKVTHIRFFAPDGNSLGSVSMRPRGNFITMSIQRGLSALAPAFCSLLWLYLLRTYLYPYIQQNVWLMVLFIYLCVSVILHASLSGADIAVGLKGLPGCLLVVFLIFLIWKIYPGDLCMKLLGVDPYAVTEKLMHFIIKK